MTGVLHHTKANGEREPLEIGGSWWRTVHTLGAFAGSEYENLADAAPAEHGADPDRVVVGDQVIVTHAAFDRYPGKCVAITGEQAVILMKFFGSERRVPAPLSALVKAEKPH